MFVGSVLHDGLFIDDTAYQHGWLLYRSMSIRAQLVDAAIKVSPLLLTTSKTPGAGGSKAG